MNITQKTISDIVTEDYTKKQYYVIIFDLMNKFTQIYNRKPNEQEFHDILNICNYHNPFTCITNGYSNGKGDNYYFKDHVFDPRRFFGIIGGKNIFNFLDTTLLRLYLIHIKNMLKNYYNNNQDKPVLFTLVSRSECELNNDIILLFQEIFSEFKKYKQPDTYYENPFTTNEIYVKDVLSTN